MRFINGGILEFIRFGDKEVVVEDDSIIVIVLLLGCEDFVDGDIG